MSHTHRLLVPYVLTLLILIAQYSFGDGGTMSQGELHAQAVAESLVPIRPGVPGKVPFWNEYARRFMYAPAFEAEPAEGAAYYRFTVHSDADDKDYVFEAAEPWTALSPVWNEIPTGPATLTVEGLDAVGGRVIGPATVTELRASSGAMIGQPNTRDFYRSAVFGGPYAQPVRPYAESARWALQFQLQQPHYQSLKEGRFGDYRLGCFLTKMLGAVIKGMVRYAGLDPRPDDADEALLVARGAFDYLMKVSEPAGAPFEYMPPTYYIEPGTPEPFKWWKERGEGVLMLHTPAEAGHAYLDLYQVTGNEECFQAAKRIADTYARTQREDGTWPLTARLATGEAFRDIPLVPLGPILYLDRLVTEYDLAEYKPALERAVQWVWKNVYQSFKWSGQFDDSPSPHVYANLTFFTPTQLAVYLLNHAEEDPNYVVAAQELLRFAEDQFVIWEKPSLRWDNAFTPCVLEQYGCYHPFDGSASVMIKAWLKAYKVTGKRLYLEKAKALATTQTIVQHHGTGQYLTTWYLDAHRTYWREHNWDNCATHSACALIELGRLLKEKQMGVSKQ